MFDNNDDDDLHDDDLDGEEEEGQDPDDTDDTDDDDGSDNSDGDDADDEDDGSEHDADEDDEGEDGEEGEEGQEGDDDDDLDPDTVDELANQDDDGNPTVPKARLDEVLERARILEEENARLKGGKPDGEDEPEFDLEAKVKEQIEKQLEGDVDGAAAIALEIEKHRQKVATTTAMSVLREDRQQRSIQKAVDQVLKDYPQLDSTKKAKFDNEAFEQVMALRNFYITEKKMPIQSALRKAADLVMKRGAKGPAKGGKDEGLTEDQKRIDRLKKRAKNAGRQPPETGKMGEGNRASHRINVDDIDPDDLSDEELDELERKDPKAFAKLLGNA